MEGNSGVKQVRATDDLWSWSWSWKSSADDVEDFDLCCKTIGSY